MNTWGQGRLNRRAEAVEKSSPEGSVCGGGVMVTERGGVAGVWMMGALARWMLGRIRRVRETEREKMKETGGRWRKKGLGG